MTKAIEIEKARMPVPGRCEALSNSVTAIRPAQLCIQSRFA
jgi:hypothetical protein